MQSSNSGANHAVLHAQNDRRGLGPIESCNFGAKKVVLFAQIHRWGLRHIETSNSSGKHAVCMHKSTDEVWDK